MQELIPLRQLVLRHTSGFLTTTALPRVSLVVSHAPTTLTSGLYRPMLCLVLQGAKEAIIGGQTLRYDQAGYFIASLDLPASARITEASAEKPYICLILSFDLECLTALIPQVPVRASAPQDGRKGFAISPVTVELLAAWQRLLGLLDTPEDIAVLAPLFEREVLYRLLQGPHGGALRQIASSGSQLAGVRRAIAWIREHFQASMRVEELADLAGMSPASFHRHFKLATALSPKQYQKNLRLQEARKLMLVHSDAARAAFAVGYESPSQFSREYARLFGAPPTRDAQRLNGQRLDEIAGG